jgi:hypothetical protein
MPAVHIRPDPLAPSALAASWLAAAAAVPITLALAAAGQGLGTLAAGGGWIGLSLPWDRQVWALVNQPVLNFASLPAAAGYWLGSVAVPLGIAAIAMPVSLRLRTLGGQLAAIQLGYVSLTVAALWQPGLAAGASQVARWLAFRGLAVELRWLPAAVAVAAAVPITLRLIAAARITRFGLTRIRRLALVGLHLIPAPVGWAALSTATAGDLPVESCLVAGLPVAAALVTAWVGFPAPLTHPVSGTRAATVFAFAGLAVVVWGALIVAGRPLSGDHRAAIQWGRETGTNNIRPWMAPLRAPWLDRASTPDK